MKLGIRFLGRLLHQFDFLAVFQKTDTGDNDDVATFNAVAEDGGIVPNALAFHGCSLYGRCFGVVDKDIAFGGIATLRKRGYRDHIGRFFITAGQQQR